MTKTCVKDRQQQPRKERIPGCDFFLKLTTIVKKIQNSRTKIYKCKKLSGILKGNFAEHEFEKAKANETYIFTCLVFNAINERPKLRIQ